MVREIPKVYQPQKLEPKWASHWVEQGLFTASSRSPKPMFSLAIPPPNVTGSLHIGHMLEHTQIDILVRWKRMCGFNTLWLPGTDHAGIATQLVVERMLAEEYERQHPGERRTGSEVRKQMGRAAFEQRIWQWKEQSGDTIKKQMVRLGASCDWSRERFTLDPALSRAVREVFVRLYEEGLIYRGKYIINWCPHCQTALSDLEVVHEDRPDKIYYLRYPVMGTKDHIVIATTRPETMLGDTAVAVHPDDPRFRHLVGKSVRLPLMEREIPILADSFVEREFGSGAVKVTPGHDPNDFEVGLRYQLQEINIMDEEGRINENGGAYTGLDRFEARARIMVHLAERGLVEKVEEYTHAIGTCQRCKTIVEPRASTQWFVRIKPLAEPAIAAVERGWIRILPENYAKVYFDWMCNIRDWCISRQLWWGHRIPAWHCRDCSVVTVAREAPPRCSKCSSLRLEQDSDVLDTWFSSALWPFSTLGWPDETEDLARFYPTSLMINGFDILFFWDARMIMMGLHLLNRAQLEDCIPFRKLFIHQLVRDAERQKMSKTRGNVIDPLEVTEKYGTDAVRFTLAISAAPGTDIALSEERIASYRAFANKIWNAGRFLLLNLDKVEEVGLWKIAELAGPGARAAAPHAPDGNLPLVDRWLFSRLNRVTGQLREALEEFRFHEAAHLIYHFFWHEFCDWYIEWLKPQIALGTARKPDRATGAAWRNLLAVFDSALRLLHPFMPFVTEELWQQLPHAGASIALQKFPEVRSELLDDEAEKQMGLVQEAIVALRNIRAEMRLDPKRRVPATLAAEEPPVLELFRKEQDAVRLLAGLSRLDFSLGHLTPDGGVVRRAARFDVRIEYGEAMDIAAELSRLRREKEKLERELARIQGQLENQQFLEKAPAEVRRTIQQRQTERSAQYQKLVELLASLEKVAR